MKNTKIALFIGLLFLGNCILYGNIGFAQETIAESETEESAIKANKETLEKAKSYMDNKDYQSAIALLTGYINGKPKKYEPYKLRGECFYALKQFKLAEEDFQTAVDLKSADDKFITGTKVVSAVVLGADKNDQRQNPELGNLYGELMYAQKALNDPAYENTYQKAFEYNSHIYLPQPKKEDIAKINCPQKYGKVLNPKGADAYIYGVIDDIENGNFHEAAYKLPNITTAYPDYYFGYYLTGVVMAGLEQDKDAIDSFEKALKYNPYDFESFASLGQIYYNKAEKTFSSDDAKKSVEYFEKALIYNPNCYLYYYYIGLNNLILGKNDSAISNFNTAIKFKSNDYNSMYYKLIAQQINRDYNSVIDGTTKLLYRHVSNYNSVLYLRALAYYKLGNNEMAISDIEKVFNNMNDIYNADIKQTSRKEKQLENYLYYLKAQILKEQGDGVKSDLDKAFENPIIKALDSNNFNISISPTEFDTQYDYIRTTFKDFKISYNNDNYKIVSINQDKIVNNKSDEEETKTPESGKITMKQSTNPVDTLTNDNQLSIAQMLATESLPQIQKQEPSIDEITKLSQEVPKTAETITEAQSSEVITKDEPQKIEQVTNTQTNTAQIVAEKSDEKVAENLNTVYDNVKTTTQTTEALVNAAPKVDKEPEVLAQESSGKEANIVGKTSEEIIPAEEPQKVVEKHAQVDLSKFDVTNKNVLEIKADDEIIVYEPEKFLPKVEEVSSKDLEIKNPNKITDNFSQIHKTAEKIDEKIEQTSDVIPEKVSDASDAISQEPQKNEPEPEINLPELTLPEKPKKIESELPLVSEEVREVPQLRITDNDEPEAETPKTPEIKIEEFAPSSVEELETKGKSKKSWFKKENNAKNEEVAVSDKKLDKDSTDESKAKTQKRHFSLKNLFKKTKKQIIEENPIEVDLNEKTE